MAIWSQCNKIFQVFRELWACPRARQQPPSPEFLSVRHFILWHFTMRYQHFGFVPRPHSIFRGEAASAIKEQKIKGQKKSKSQKERSVVFVLPQGRHCDMIVGFYCCCLLIPVGSLVVSEWGTLVWLCRILKHGCLFGWAALSCSGLTAAAVKGKNMSSPPLLKKEQLSCRVFKVVVR